MTLSDPLFVLGGTPITVLHALLAAGGIVLLMMALVLRAVGRADASRAAESAAQMERARELDDRLAEITRASAELAGRMASAGETFTQQQTHLARFVSERLDQVSQRVGQTLTDGARASHENLSKLGERLAVIDAAQARLTGLTQEVVGLKDILANKQARGAYGQGRMEAIVRDGLPSDAYTFQKTLSNGMRPDCAIILPGDERVMVVDAKFPLEGFTALKEAAPETRGAALQRVRADVIRHIKDIADKYFIAGETQDIAVLFVPSESLYADLNEHFEDVVQRAHRARVIIVSPSLLMMAIQVMQAIVRDARMREQAHVIQKEVAALVEDVARLRDRTVALSKHFGQVSDDIDKAMTSADKIAKRGEKIGALDFSEAPKPPLAPYASAAE